MTRSPKYVVACWNDFRPAATPDVLSDYAAELPLLPEACPGPRAPIPAPTPATHPPISISTRASRAACVGIHTVAGNEGKYFAVVPGPEFAAVEKRPHLLVGKASNQHSFPGPGPDFDMNFDSVSILRRCKSQL